MKPKKTKKANLENKRTILLQIGMILTLSAVLFAFEWKTGAELEDVYISKTDWIETEELPPITRPEQEKKVEKPPVPVEKFIIKDNNVDIDDELEIESTEIGFFDEVNIKELEDGPEEVDDEPFLSAQFMPTFQGKGVAHFRNYVMKNVEFPISAAEMGIAGKVYATFVVDRDGSVIDVEILRNVDPLIDKEVIRVIENSPRWEPGINEGEYVKVRFSIAIAFKLE